MEYNKEIYAAFLGLVTDCLDNTLDTFKIEVQEDSRFKYGLPEEKKEYLINLKNQEREPVFNYYKVKGVKYSRGKYEILQNEFEDLVKEYDVNLFDNDNGLFLNEFDTEKPKTFRSYFQVILIMGYCLELQIINEMIEDLKLNLKAFNVEVEYDETIFPNPCSFQFFNSVIQYAEFEFRRKWVSQLYRYLKVMNDGKHDIYLRGNEIQFAEYWNGLDLSYKIPIYTKSVGLDSTKNRSVEHNKIESWYNSFEWTQD